MTLTDQDWQARLALVCRSARRGWRAELSRVAHGVRRGARHVFVPTVLTDDEAGPTAVSGHDPAQREAWLDLVYTDTSLVTQYLEHPSIRTVADRPLPVPTSSSTMPSLMATDVGGPGRDGRAAGFGDWHRDRLQRGAAVSPAGLSQCGKPRHRPRVGGSG